MMIMKYALLKFIKLIFDFELISNVEWLVEWHANMTVLYYLVGKNHDILLVIL